MDRDLNEDIRRSRILLGNPYAYLNDEGGFDAIPRRDLAAHEPHRLPQKSGASPGKDGGHSQWSGDADQPSRKPLRIDADQLLDGRKKGRRFSKREIETIARKLQAELWLRRGELWPGREAIEPLDILDPSLVFETIGYSVKVSESLGQYSGQGELFEVAGILDNSNSHVEISRRFVPEIRKFTTAHELGHAILHAESGLHRDRALDGAAGGGSRDTKEIEADNFAAYFLLPEKQVRKAFAAKFLTKRFVLDEATAFALEAESVDSLLNRCRTRRDLARVLASAERYNGVQFHSMAQQFGVSTEAMAIRLEELRLLQD
jgi:Zn-dependent peptidase ImmA (M78 family)